MMTSLLTFLSTQGLGLSVALAIDEVVWVLPSVVVALIIDVTYILNSLEFILSKFEMNGYSSEFCCRLDFVLVQNLNTKLSPRLPSPPFEPYCSASSSPSVPVRLTVRWFVQANTSRTAIKSLAEIKGNYTHHFPFVH